MNRYKITSTGRCRLFQYVNAETKEEAIKQWEASDPSLDEVDEESVDSVAYFDCELVGLARTDKKL